MYFDSLEKLIEAYKMLTSKSDDERYNNSKYITYIYPEIDDIDIRITIRTGLNTKYMPALIGQIQLCYSFVSKTNIFYPILQELFAAMNIKRIIVTLIKVYYHIKE